MSDVVKVEFIYLPVVNFAMQQNRVSVIRRLSIENLTESVLNNVRIEFSAEPAFGTATPVLIEFVPERDTVSAEIVSLNLSADYFVQLTESISGYITIGVFVKSEPVYRKSYPIDILAYDQWGGTFVLPEMLVAFVTLNHPAIIPVIRRVSEILEQWTNDSSLNEYQSQNPDRVRMQMAAVYTAISEQDILYSTVPVNIESSGQHIRLSDVIMSQKLGTCLDMSLLYASCLEAIGIHSLIFVMDGHAFAGGWLVPETFPDSVIDDVSLLTKRIADGINDIVPVEITCANSGVGTGFDQAAKIAGEKLLQPGFVLALDVKRIRLSGIKPIPQRVLNGQHWVTEKQQNESEEKSSAIPQSINPYDLSGISAEIEVTKQLLWERKLLDLSLRNNLLNIRVTKNTLQLISANLSLFEDALAGGDEFQILHKPADWTNPLHEYGLYQNVAEADPVIGLIKSELTQKRLRSYLSEFELGKALNHLYRSSRTSMEENGANTLYLALGLLKWYETKMSERPRYAPILLIPVEIIRKSAAKGYVIRSREEESMMNITLLEMLRQNFNINITGLCTLPTDDSGINVNLIYSIIRNSIKDQSKWDVEEQAILGIFSFNKFIMWNDIHNNSHKLVKNEIVSSLMSGRIEWEEDFEMADASYLDKKMLPSDIMLPISADSSQLEAIYEAANDKSFILHGPPGTGKSQTITNLIANALYRGKRVLFVAEKMAALTVVQKRLAAIGLAPFCLEMHSNKTKKSNILSQLKETTEIIRTVSPENFKQEAERLHKLRLELSKYVEALHFTYSFGSSLYEAITRYQHLNVEPEFEIPQTYISDLNKELVLQWQEVLASLVSMANAYGHPYNHPLTGIKISGYSSIIKEEALGNLNDMINLLSEIKLKLKPLFFLFGTETFSSKNDIGTASGIIDKMLHIPELTPALLKLSGLSERLDECREVCLHGREFDKARQRISAGFSDGVFSVDAKQSLVKWNQVSARWFLPKYFGQRKIRKLLSGYAFNGINKYDIVNILSDIIKYQEEKIYIERNTGNFSVMFGKSGRKGNENWNTIEQIIDDFSIINKLILKLTGNISGAVLFKERLAGHLSDGIISFKSLYGDKLTEMYDLILAMGSKEQVLSDTLGISEGLLYEGSENWMDSALKKLNVWKDNIDKLKGWHQWLLVRNNMDLLKIGFVADEYKERNIETSKITDIFNKSFYKAVISFIISKEPVLELFKGSMFVDIIEKYKRFASDFEVLTRKELFARLASNLPSFSREATQNSEVGILQRNIRNNARGISIRRLFDQIPTLLSRMCPCMLMSPISVAQYIDIEADKFDLIVFDEASQMPTCQAIGAIARGKNVVIVGDPKQMPPTNFFAVNSIDEDHIEMEDLESILDDCLSLSMPSRHLLWHYRSKHESLIAFSNTEYYENKLLTFPSPDNIESKVRLVLIGGFYDKGRSRQNKAEAQAVIEEIARRLCDEELRRKSIGVVTFSMVQQSLVEDLLSEMFIKNPELEALALECEEPLFVKNLENVQGDERDVILFSVGYGPDKDGGVSMNFGPLNRTGGERRLNVAVSRARYEMIIFSTMRSEQIDLNRTSSIGVAGLKRFLEYAEKGSNIVYDKQQALLPSEVSLHALIAGKLRSLGYVVHTDIGCSGYKIDIGIVDNENPSKYKLGIICDGENYKRTKTVRDREIIQSNVLKMLGWNICRVWTLDWWENPEEVLELINNAVNKAVVSESNNDHLIDNKSANEYFATNGLEPVNDVRIVSLDSTGTETSEVLNESVESDYHHYETMPVKYVPAALRMVVKSSDVFFNNENKGLILNQIKEVVEAEAPISRALLCKRILSSWSISRLGQRLDAYIDALLAECSYFRTHYENLTFYWLDKLQNQRYNIYRFDSGRDAVDLPPEEVANGMKKILKDEISLPVSDLFRVCAQQFGFLRSGSNIDAAMMRGLDIAIRKGYIKTDNGRVIIV
ncbi:MAG: DUF3320 domain-containing protein [Tannerella sp.]|jgi:superfamily I DNA and/or RNA helicase|nr:DUF3320 domain-containing protein [Tannerella sp.]